MNTQPTLTIGREAFETALKHGVELWFDGSTPTARLDQRNGRNGFTRYVNARIEGKLAEVAFANFIEYNYGVVGKVDWRIYGEYEQTDHGDLQWVTYGDGQQQPAVEFDVKKTKPYNQWLAIRTEIFNQHPDDAPFILTKLQLKDDIELRQFESYDDFAAIKNSKDYQQTLRRYVDNNRPVEVEIVGTAYPDEFTDHFEQGDRLYDPDTGRKLGGGLRRPNKGIHVSDLIATEDRWDRIVDEICGTTVSDSADVR